MEKGGSGVAVEAGALHLGRGGREERRGDACGFLNGRAQEAGKEGGEGGRGRGREGRYRYLVHEGVRIKRFQVREELFFRVGGFGILSFLDGEEDAADWGGEEGGRKGGREGHPVLNIFLNCGVRALLQRLHLVNDYPPS